MRIIRTLALAAALTSGLSMHAAEETSAVKKVVLSSLLGAGSGITLALATCNHESGPYSPPQWVFVAPFYACAGAIAGPLTYLAYKNLPNNRFFRRYGWWVIAGAN